MKLSPNLRKKNPKRLPGFTLNELLVVLVIISILIMLALPALLPLVNQARSTEAKMQLKHLYSLQESHYLFNAAYSTNLEEIGFVQQKLVNEGGNANYLIWIEEASQNSFLAVAESKVDFDGDGVLNRWEIDENNDLKETVKD